MMSTFYPKTESWKKGSDCCSWDGVTCDWVTGHVIELDLSCSWLFGTIHSNTTLFHLPHLQRLNLAFNNFRGSSISAGFGRFSSLTHLNLCDSEFSGPISPEISHLSNLVSLDLSWNIDTEFAPHGFDSLVQNLTKLQKLHLGGISISSIFPKFLLNWASLVSLDLLDGALHGRFPDHDIHLPKLEVLDLRWNNGLSGTFPQFSENNSLTELYLSSKNFSGELPASIGNLKSLKILVLHNCGFSGSIPSSIGNLKSLMVLAMPGCEFSGSIPASLGNLTQIIACTSIGIILVLDLSHNKLTGHIGEFQFDSLEYIDLMAFWRQATLGKLRNLTSLDLSNNMLSLTTSDDSKSMLPYIESLDLSNNNISGIWSWNMGKNTLQYLNLSYNLIRRNRFHGIIPQTFLKGNAIRNLDFNGNQLEGLLPRSLIICRKLEGVPKSNPHSLSLRIIDLAYNDFEGDLPEMYLRSLKATMNVDEGNMTRKYMGTVIIRFRNGDNQGVGD
ncbi:leucine-rich repeat receptor-like protein kinase [Vitis vinifera]|uniref:Leucine-rich repeat receptor-like protein kinase n=1 Tax=Vitis vinifera TaxID=29760 RepID=A0A438GRV5_VITVI|nr:leucine-rich repeat receptor-like protein kinase [Vitis vinifera]